MIHKESDQCFIGPYVVDAKGNWKHIPELDEFRLTSIMRHLTDPANRIYYQGRKASSSKWTCAIINRASCLIS